jgi:hypothetical protein
MPAQLALSLGASGDGREREYDRELRLGGLPKRGDGVEQGLRGTRDREGHGAARGQVDRGGSGELGVGDRRARAKEVGRHSVRDPIFVS